MHLRWQFTGGSNPQLREVSVVIRVINPPAVPSLYFWALQASFIEAGRTAGAAHLGLQHHPRHPGGGAVNWGGYVHGGGELEGSHATLPSALNNMNTRDYPWRAGAAYLYRIARSPERGWRASITDIERRETTVIRDLWAPGDTGDEPHGRAAGRWALSDVVMWSEVFADCDAPSVTIEWSDPRAVTLSGESIQPVAMVTNYQTHLDGGCANTTAAITNDGIAQITNTARIVPRAATLALRHSI